MHDQTLANVKSQLINSTLFQHVAGINHRGPSVGSLTTIIHGAWVRVSPSVFLNVKTVSFRCKEDRGESTPVPVAPARVGRERKIHSEMMEIMSREVKPFDSWFHLPWYQRFLFDIFIRERESEREAARREKTLSGYLDLESHFDAVRPFSIMLAFFSEFFGKTIIFFRFFLKKNC